MRKSRFTEEQIIKVLKEHAAGLSAADVCRKPRGLDIKAGAAKLKTALPMLEAVDTDFFSVLGHKEDRFAKSLRKLWRKRRLDGMPGAEKAEAEAAKAAPKPRRVAAKTKPVAAAKKPTAKRAAKLEATGT